MPVPHAHMPLIRWNAITAAGWAFLGSSAGNLLEAVSLNPKP